MINLFVKKLYCFLLIFLLFFSCSGVEAVNFSISPLIINIEEEARYSTEKKLTITNQDNRPIRLYASVNEITLGENSEIKTFVPASMSDQSITPTSWIQISRARLEVPTGEAVEIPLIIKVNPSTKPGLYHAYVGFAEGANRDEAEAKILKGQGSGVVLRFDISSKRQEFLRLVSFSTSKFTFFNKDNSATYVLENTGDVAVTSVGDLIIYDSRGREITDINLNHDASASIEPGEQKSFTTELPYSNRIGKNKAFLSLTYGTDNKASIYDTNFYYSIPWYYLLMIIILFMTAVISILLLIRRNYINQNDDLPDIVQEVPLFVANKKTDHNIYDHDIDLKNNKK